MLFGEVDYHIRKVFC